MRDIPYAIAIGSLMYNQTCTRLNINFAVGMLSRYQSNPSIYHWITAKKALRYLAGTMNYMLTYKRSNHLEVTGYSNSDFAFSDTRKLTSEYTFLLAEGVVSWKSVKQTHVTTSSSCRVCTLL